MRIVLWNTNNGINQKSQIDYLKSFKPDLAILPELKEKNIETLEAVDSVWVTNNHKNKVPKGLGVLSFRENIKLELQEFDRDMEIYLPIIVSVDEFKFNLLAVWNFYSACKQGRFKDVKGEECLEYSALRHYKDFFRDPCLIAGDWNLGPTFAQDAYERIINMLSESKIQCLYKSHHNIKYGQEDYVTFKPSKGKSLHILDHIFGSSMFQNIIEGFKVGKFEENVLSDHTPLIIDVNLDLAQLKKSA